MKKRVAIPVQAGLLSEYFGGCSHYEIFELERKLIGQYNLPVPDGTGIAELPAWLAKNKVTDVIAYKADREIIREFALRKINLFMGVQVDTPQNIIDAYQQGWLESDATIIKELILPVAGDKKERLL